MVAIPSALEQELSAAISEACGATSQASWSIIANALATHREWCSNLATAIVGGVQTDARFTDDELDALATSPSTTWTPAEIRELIDAHRALRQQVRDAHALIPQALAGRRKK
jgi:hypothetical protein